MFSRNAPVRHGDSKVTVAEILLWAEIQPEAWILGAHFYTNILFLNYWMMLTSKVVKTILTNKHCLRVNCYVLRLQKWQNNGLLCWIIYREAGKQKPRIASDVGSPLTFEVGPGVSSVSLPGRWCLITNEQFSKNSPPASWLVAVGLTEFFIVSRLTFLIVPSASSLLGSFGTSLLAPLVMFLVYS